MINIIAAMAKNRVIGKNGKMPWHFSKDLQHFKNLTEGSPIIMGRTTFESIGRLLPNRTSIIVSRTNDLEVPKGAYLVNSVEDAIDTAKNLTDGDIWIIGGGSIYKYVLDNNLADRIYLTVIDKEFEGDTYFSEINDEWKVVESKSLEDNQTKLLFEVFEKHHY